MKDIDGYFLYGVDDEMLLVIRGHDEEKMLNIINRLLKSRDKELKELGKTLEEHFVERQDDGRRSRKAQPKNP